MAKDRRSGPRYSAAFLNFGTTLAAGMFIFFKIGQWLDARWGTKPWLALLGIILGLAVGFKSLFTEIFRLERGDRDRGTK